MTFSASTIYLSGIHAGDLRSIVEVTTPPDVTQLVTLDRVKQELSIDTDKYDNLLSAKIDEASSDIESHLGRTLSHATLTQTLWSGPGWAERFLLQRWPVGSITSVVVDDVAVESSLYRLDGDTGAVYKLDSNGYPCVWEWCKSVIIVYEAGYYLPGENNRDLPYPIESAAIDLVTSYWQNRGRDQSIMQEDVPGLGTVRYWVGAQGDSGDLPPGVMAKISAYRRQHV